MNRNNWYIYQLESPTGEVRYIGATTNPERRYKEHLSGVKQGKQLKKWVQSLLKQGKAPRMLVLEQTNWINWQERERFWISQRKKYGKLLNKQPGGIVKRRRKNG
jgi:hypothetical protein